LPLGTRLDGAAATLPPNGVTVLIAGPSGSGKVPIATSFLQSLSDHQYQFCVIDPEGDYQRLAGAVTLGSSQGPPTVEEILDVLAKPKENAVVNLLGITAAERPAFFLTVLARLQEMRAGTGRPHWLVIDEAHRLLPLSWKPAESIWPSASHGTLLITPHVEQVAPAALRRVNVVLAVGNQPRQTLEQFCRPLGERLRFPTPTSLEPGDALWWDRRSTATPCLVRVASARAQRERHSHSRSQRRS
jgi:hypothetical protein